MSINVGDLVIGLKADVARLQTDMTAAKSSVQGAMKDIETYVGYAKTAFLGLGGVLSVDAFASVISGAIEFKARLLDLSTQTGIGVTALGALSNVGKLTGTSLDDVSSASAKLSKAIETQNEDSKGAAQAIQALGLNYNQFKQLKPEDQLVAVAKAMAGFADGTGKTADAMLLFGKAGAGVLPFLRDLASNTDLNSKQTIEASQRAKEYEDNLRKLKIAGDEWKAALVDEITPSLAAFTKQMVEASTWGDKFTAILGNIGDHLGVAKTPLDEQSLALQRLNHELIAASRQYDLMKASDGGLLSKLLGSSTDLEQQRQKIEAIQKQITAASEALKSAASVESPLGNPNYGNEGHGKPKPKITGLDGTPNGPKPEDLYAKLIKTVNERIAQQDTEADKGRALTEIERLQAKAYADIDTGVIKATLSQKLYVDGLFQTALEEEKLAKEREESSKENDKTLDDADRRLQSLHDETKSMQDQLEQFGLTTEQLQAVSSEKDRYTASQLKGRAAALDSIGAEGQLRDLYLAQADALDHLAAQKDELAAKEAREHNDPNAGAARAVKDYLDTVKKAGDATYDAVQSSMRSLEDSTVSILGGSNAKQAARAWVNGLISEIQRLVLVRPLIASITGGTGTSGFLAASGSVLGAIGSFFGGSSLTVDTGGMGTNLSGSVSPVAGGRAAGGPVSAGQSYLVGEHGPEVLRMGNQAGAVTPNGGGDVHIQIVNNTGVAANARAQKQSDGSYQVVLEKVLEAVAGDLHSGGKVSQAMSNTFGLNRAGSAPRY